MLDLDIKQYKELKYGEDIQKYTHLIKIDTVPK